MLPEKYQGVEESELIKRIQKIKDEKGDELVILGHHYQRDEVFQFADFAGDSFKLAQDAAKQKKAKDIVFCGVHFMAEAARIVCAKDQRVYLPDMDAGCPMADLADIDDVEVAWEELSKNTDISKVVPITYMNSTAAIKAFCGKHSGIVCTSSNAKKIFEWAFSRGEKIFFLPDEHLGRNTSRDLGAADSEVSLWKQKEELGGLSKDEIEQTKVFVWNGYCHVHTYFSEEHINEARKKYPDAKIVVHPECRQEIVKLADASGSTGQIIKYAEEQPAGSTIVIGTEINMVSRLASDHKDKTILPLARSLCPNMFKISLSDLCWTLEELGNVNEINVDPEVSKNAKLALERMLEFG